MEPLLGIEPRLPLYRNGSLPLSLQGRGARDRIRTDLFLLTKQTLVLTSITGMEARVRIALTIFRFAGVCLAAWLSGHGRNDRNRTCVLLLPKQARHHYATFRWYLVRELNPCSSTYEAAALPLSYRGLVLGVGFEPTWFPSVLRTDPFGHSGILAW